MEYGSHQLKYPHGKRKQRRPVASFLAEGHYKIAGCSSSSMRKQIPDYGLSPERPPEVSKPAEASSKGVLRCQESADPMSNVITATKDSIRISVQPAKTLRRPAGFVEARFITPGWCAGGILKFKIYTWHGLDDQADASTAHNFNRAENAPKMFRVAYELSEVENGQRVLHKIRARLPRPLTTTDPMGSKEIP